MLAISEAMDNKKRNIIDDRSTTLFQMSESWGVDRIEHSIIII